MKDQLVTTIIPVFNRAEMLKTSVDSVLAQTWRPIEVLIIDDGSTDSTSVVADTLQAEHPEQIRVIHQQNSGVGLAREAGRLQARGSFIQHLDSDDILLPRKFQLQVQGLNENPHCGVSYGWTRARFRDDPPIPHPWKRTGERIETMFPAFLQSRWWETSTPLYRREIIDAAGPWTSLRMEEDWEYDARIASLGVRLHFVEDWVAEKHEHGFNQLSGGKQTVATLRDRATAHRLILSHARAAGIGPEVPEMQHFARELFLLSRQCAAAGLTVEAEMLFALSRDASGPARDRLQFKLFAAAAKTLGWPLTGRIAALMDRLR